jgi:hypothetical protein
MDDPVDVAAAEQIELDAAEARRWMLAVARDDDRPGLGRGDAGVFGDRVALLDFDAEDLTRLRRLVPVVRLVAHPQVESAIAISGSSAQGRVQLFPGDADFFERAHIRASDAEEAAVILRELMRSTALRAITEPDVVLVEVNLGVYREPVVERGRQRGAGDAITWSPADVVNGFITVEATDGAPGSIAWDEVAVAGGWVYLGWIVADRDEGRIALASNMIDATWEDETGVVRSLDGAIDPLSQEIYLEPAAMDLVQRVAGVVAPSAEDAYREAMRGEVHHYTLVEPSFAKAAKRLYNLFRVSDELEAAAYVRELFDEPPARLYQVPGLLEAADAALDESSGIDRDTVLRQLDLVADAIVDVTEGSEEATLVAALRELRDAALDEDRDDEQWAEVLADVRARCSQICSDYFRDRLLAYRRVREIVDELATLD